MRIRLLGTGTPRPSLKRMGSSYLVEIGRDVLLFDVGPGAYHRMMEAGVKATQVSHLFFSHLHYDHCCDYARLVLTRWDQGAGRIPDLRVYGPPSTIRMTELLFGKEGVFGPDITARVNHQASLDIFKARGGVYPREGPAPAVTELRSGSVVEGEGWSVTAASVVHVQPYLSCYGYRLDSPEGSFVYSGDTGPCEAMVELARDCDVLVHMCHYLSGTGLGSEYRRAVTDHRELAQLGQKARVKNLVVSHVTKQMDVPGVRERVIREMAEIYEGHLFFGEDLMEIPTAPPRPAKLVG